MGVPEMPALAGVHHLKLPVTDLARSREWYRSRLGYQVQVEFAEQGQLMGYALAHPNGGPPLGLRLDPGRARAAAGFDYFAIGVPGKDAIDQLAARLDALGEQHAGVHWASIGWILPHLHDPDGHEIRFYTIEHHTEPAPGQVTTIHDPRETAGLREQAATRQPPDGPAAGARSRLEENDVPDQGPGTARSPHCRTAPPGRAGPGRHPARQACRASHRHTPGRRRGRGYRPPPPRPARLHGLPAARRADGGILPVAAPTRPWRGRSAEVARPAEPTSTCSGRWPSGTEPRPPTVTTPHQVHQTHRSLKVTGRSARYKR